MQMGLLTDLRQRRLEELARSAGHCRLCSRLWMRTRVLSQANGNVDARVMFVAEAPGRLGADRTGVPLLGDRTGENFSSLLGNIGWDRAMVFITNALLCNPRDDAGNNGTPSLRELDNCSAYLAMTIQLVDPEVVVTLGRIALDALRLICHHPYQLRDDVAQALPWANRVLFPMYHPAPRALVHRSMLQQRADYIRLSKTVHPEKGLVRQRRSQSPTIQAFPTAMEDLISVIVHSLEQITYFRLCKLLYLIDLAFMKETGRTLTGAVYLRQEDGPWSPSFRNAIKRLQGYEIGSRTVSGELQVFLGPSPRFRSKLTDEELATVLGILDRYGGMDSRRLKTVTYLTGPMRHHLAQEAAGRDVRRTPLLSDKASPQTGEPMNKEGEH